MDMEITAADTSETNAPPQKTQRGADQQARREALAAKFAEVRRAKKKEKRARHRAKLRRSHTDG
jgi:hypothetical protein